MDYYHILLSNGTEGTNSSTWPNSNGASPKPGQRWRATIILKETTNLENQSLPYPPIQHGVPLISKVDQASDTPSPGHHHHLHPFLLLLLQPLEHRGTPP